MQLDHLDPRTRALMHGEVQLDLARGGLYLSPRLSDAGRAGYVPVLLDAFARGDTKTFATDLARRRGFFNTHESSHRRGIDYVKAVPRDAHVTLAEGEFNRFYLRALCVRAAEDGIPQLQICRAKVVHNPRWESERRIGTFVDAVALLTDLRTNIGVDLALGIPNGPNSGLSARLPANSNMP